MKSEFVLLAVHRHLFERRAALGRAVVDDRVGDGGADLKRAGVVGDGIGHIGGGGLIACLDADAVLAGVQVGGVAAAAAGEGPAVELHGLHRIGAAVPLGAGGKGQRALRHGAKLAQLPPVRGCLLYTSPSPRDS